MRCYSIRLYHPLKAGSGDGTYKAIGPVRLRYLHIDSELIYVPKKSRIPKLHWEWMQKEKEEK